MIPMAPKECCWGTSQGCYTYSLLPWGAVGLPLRGAVHTHCTLGVLLDYLLGHAHWLHPWGAVGLPLRANFFFGPTFDLDFSQTLGSKVEVGVFNPDPGPFIKLL